MSRTAAVSITMSPGDWKLTRISFCIVQSIGRGARSLRADSRALNLDWQIFDFNSFRPRDRNIGRNRVQFRTQLARGVHISETDFEVNRETVFDDRFGDHSKRRIAIFQAVAEDQHAFDRLQALAFGRATLRRFWLFSD